jgi:hypothetical protein
VIWVRTEAYFRWAEDELVVSVQIDPRQGLATLEEIVDWQPYDRVAWRLTVPGLGPVAATADLDPTESGTHLRLRWGYLGGVPAEADAVESLRVDKKAAYARLATVVTGTLPVVEQEEARS